MGYVKLTRMMLLFEYHGAELGFGAHNREILDYIKSELSGLEKSLRAGEVQIEDLDETTFEDFKAFLGGYAFRQSFANLNPATLFPSPRWSSSRSQEKIFYATFSCVA